MSIPVFPALSLLSLSLSVCFAELMDGAISPAAVNEAEKVCGVDVTVTHFSQDFPRPTNYHFTVIYITQMGLFFRLIPFAVEAVVRKVVMD